MRAVMLAPLTWTQLSRLISSDFEPPTAFLHRLPTEIYRAGTTLRAMRIQYTRPCSYAKISMSQKTSLIESIQNLKTLTFDSCDSRNWKLKHIELDFVSALVQPSSLERLTVTFSRSTFAECSKILSGGHSKCMKQLFLTKVRFEAGELAQYLVHIQGPCDVILKEVLLYGGQWAEEVDVLRGLLGVSITISGLNGAEFHDDEFREEWNPRHERELNRYIQRATSVNPFNRILYHLSNRSLVGDASWYDT